MAKNGGAAGFFAFLGMILAFVILYLILDNLIVSLLVWAGFLVIVAIILLQHEKSKQNNNEAEGKRKEEFLTFDKEDNILTLKARSSEILKYVSIRDAVDLNFKYEPEKLHIGAVAVGGVVSGGTYTTGGYYYLDSTKKNGLCSMEYGYKLISAIQLTDDLFAQAVNSDISQYLDKSAKQIIVRIHERASLEELHEAMNNLRTTAYAGNNLANKGLPTLEKAARILKWMAGE